MQSEPGDDPGGMVQTLYRRYVPNLVLRHVREGEDPEGRKPVNGMPTAWICAKGTCLPPAAGPEELEERLGEALG